jgi:hypothetical protein
VLEVGERADMWGRSSREREEGRKVEQAARVAGPHGLMGQKETGR